ncbi:MAG: aldehyde dehydrogenase family protein [Spongiibacteraceae bacterium]
MPVDLDAEIKRVFALQRSHQYVIRNATAAERKAKLEKFKQIILAHEDAICEAMYADLRRPRPLALSAELHATVAEIDDAIANLDVWMAPLEIEPSPAFSSAKVRVVHEARGQVLVLGPWNFPIGLVLSPIVPAIAAGNCVIAKPNELTPNCSAVIAKILREGFDECDVAVFEGGVDVASTLLELPFNHVFFTGSPKVGRVVMAAAAKHLASVTLELGGKSPVVIDDGVNLQDAALKIAGGRCTNAGQLCLAPDHVWIKNSVREEFLKHLRAAFQRLFYVDGKLNGDAIGKIVDARNFERVIGYISDATAHGAQIFCGGGSDAQQRTIEPTVLIDVPLNALVMEEEIFGPVLPVLGFDDLSEVLDYVQSHGKPLAAYVFSPDQVLIDRFLANTSSGGVTINGVILHAAETRLPFGGVNESGIGRYHGVHGFRELSHERAVLISPAVAI